MGVHGLLKEIEANAPDAVTIVTMEDLSGRTVAIDATIALYQFLGVFTTGGKPIVNKRGEHINHLQGFFFRTIQLLEKGIKPLYVFDGKPPEVKTDKLERRRATRKIHVTGNYFDDARILLKYMGVDTIDARGEAEATCSRLAATGKFDVSFVGSEDIDALAFGAPYMVKKLAVGGAKAKMKRIDLAKTLAGLKLTYEQFVDFCILCGSDYSVTIPGVGPKRALDLIHKYGSIDEIMRAVRKKDLDLTIPEKFDYKGARRAFLRPKVTTTITRRGRYNHADLRDFLVSKGLDITRVNSGLERLKTVWEKWNSQKATAGIASEQVNTGKR
jgi:flap endonuclease-1